MKTSKKCPICLDGKRKRLCKMNRDELICVTCCSDKQTYYCIGCSFYKDITLQFKCKNCGKTSIDDQPSDITKLMGTKIFELKNLRGKCLEKGSAVSGEIYTAAIEFPFEGKPNTAIWFYYDPDNTLYDLQLLQCEIIKVKDFNEYKAEIEIFVYQISDCRNTGNLFPEIELPERMYNSDMLFPFSILKVHTSGNLIYIASLEQDGGNWALIVDAENIPKIILYSEGWLNHWQEYAGNINIRKSYLKRILNEREWKKL